MPKRRSLVGTAREAIGTGAGPPAAKLRASPAPPAEAAPAARQRGAAPGKSKKAAMPEREATVQERSAAPHATSDGRRAPFTGSAAAWEVIAGLASATLRQNLETGVRLAQCKSPMDVLAAQTAHAMALTQKYIAVSLQLMLLGFSTASSVSIQRAEPRGGDH